MKKLGLTMITVFVFLGLGLYLSRSEDSSVSSEELTSLTYRGPISNQTFLITCGPDGVWLRIYGDSLPPEKEESALNLEARHLVIGSIDSRMPLGTSGFSFQFFGVPAPRYDDSGRDEHQNGRLVFAPRGKLVGRTLLAYGADLPN